MSDRKNEWEPAGGRSPERRSAWDTPDKTRKENVRESAGENTRKDKRDNGETARDGARDNRNRNAVSSSGKNLKTVLLVVLLVLCMLTNTVYAGARAVIGRMTIVEKSDTSDIISNTSVISSELTDDNMGEEEIDTSNLVMSDKDVEIFLVVGADFAVEEKGSRSDTIILVAIDRIHQKIKVISIMRDIYAPIVGGGGNNKINFAYYYDSALGYTDLKVTRATIEKCFGVTVDHFAVVDFNMFTDLINSLPPDGLIDVEMTKGEAQYMLWTDRWHQAINIGAQEAGVYHLDGAESLAYVRMRKEGNGDYERTERQRRFFGLMLDKAKNMTYTQMVKVLSGLLPYISTDLTENQVFGYCFEAPKLLKYEMVQFRLPIDGAHCMGWATIGSTNVSILVTNFTFLAQALQDFIYNDDMTYVNGGRASGVVLPRITTISFTTTTTAETTETTAATTAQTEDTSPASDPAPEPTSDPAPEPTSDPAPAPDPAPDADAAP